MCPGNLVTCSIDIVVNEVLRGIKKGTETNMGDSNPHGEQQYLDLVKRILESGEEREDRTGVGTLSVFGAQMRFSLNDGHIPLLTTKRVFWRGVLEELLWFIRSSTNAKELQEKRVHIWDGNSSRKFLDSLGFHHREEGDLGPVYGFQWRHFGAKYQGMHSDYTGQGVDQLQNCINDIKNNPWSRRIILCAWNPQDLPLMALPPCHLLFQFYVGEGGKLSGHLYLRSADMGLGIPFNIASYSLLLSMVAHVTNLKPHELIVSLGDAHVYKTHVDALKEQILREPRPFPKLQFKRKVPSIDDFVAEDIEIENYNPHPKLKMDMAV
ncbi:unnamed protein product [Darwinula stevensoni]|uniref:Thymidylate synthase n=1 Tax=Darwinula stevensoni TaxID=69355 RepID=A0A7R8WYP1_9CRUS|nr:unnamed protein product [Darwinula stevensoni]CAG0879167.1 unnamed protein product [Darwinula stevensoni]